MVSAVFPSWQEPTVAGPIVDGACAVDRHQPVPRATRRHQRGGSNMLTCVVCVCIVTLNL